MRESDFDHRALCPECGMGARFDEDGLCSGCGNSITPGDVLRKHLFAAGFVVLRLCPIHDLLCNDGHCEVRENAP